MRIFYCDSSPCACRRVSPAQRLPLRGAFLRRTPRHAPARSSCGASPPRFTPAPIARSEEHPSELQSLMRISYAVFCLKKKHTTEKTRQNYQMNDNPFVKQTTRYTTQT